MSDKIKNLLCALPPLGIALWLGYQVTLQITGSVEKAIERGIVAVVLWSICTLLWAALCATPEILTRVSRALGKSHGETTVIKRSAGLVGHSSAALRRR